MTFRTEDGVKHILIHNGENCNQMYQRIFRILWNWGKLDNYWKIILHRQLTYFPQIWLLYSVIGFPMPMLENEMENLLRHLMRAHCCLQRFSNQRSLVPLRDRQTRRGQFRVIHHTLDLVKSTNTSHGVTLATLPAQAPESCNQCKQEKPTNCGTKAGDVLANFLFSW